LALILLGYCGVISWFSARESEFVYFPTTSYEANPGAFGLRYEQVEIESEDGVKLAGWIISASQLDSTCMWVLYFHGNSGNIGRTGCLEHYAQLHKIGVNILAIDYRGYGRSTGEPSEAGLYVDAEAAYGYLRHAKHVPSERIIVYGYSLGAAVSINLACKVEIGGLIVEGAFTSLPNVGQEHYPYLPTQLVTRNRFTSIQKIGSVKPPKLFVHATDDVTAPLHHGRELFAAASSPKLFLEVKGTHENAHNADTEVFYSGIARFIQSIRDNKRSSQTSSY